jgi:peptide/nickel transport system substrate-binding protein
LQIVMETQPASLDPIMGNAFNSAPNIYNLLFDKLISLDSKDDPSPALAESWTLGPDMKSLTLKIRGGVRFYDGTVLDAAALKFNLDRVSAAGSKAPVSAFATDIASVENGCWAKPG